ncbi:hypothetical protein P879_03229 [Paragonimus westermani]|uniref:Uncharacterized protein n=1 Tax=Paragonimus westermani TaxID=34504 RepID=A0A8T0DIX2_9TREM|nr:hypothetical protein P879_03229 [Paragonimus westermani]
MDRKARSPSPSGPQCTTSTLPSNPQRSVSHSTNSSLLRVAAWVNSIETAVTPQLDSRPTTAPKIDYRHSLESSVNKNNVVAERKTSPVACYHPGQEEYAKPDPGDTFSSILSNVNARIPLPSVSLEFDRPTAHSSKGKLSHEQSQLGTFNVCTTQPSPTRSDFHPSFLFSYKPGHKERTHCVPSSTHNSNLYAVSSSAPSEQRFYTEHKIKGGGTNSTASFGLEKLMPKTTYSSMNSDAIQTYQPYIQPNMIHTTVNCSLRPTLSNVINNSEVNPIHFKSMEVEGQKEKNKKSNGRFRFLTLPLFRSLRLRKEKKAKMKKPQNNDCIVQSPVASTVPHLPSELAHSVMHPPASLCIQMPVMQSVNFDSFLANNCLMHPNSTSTPRRSSAFEDTQRTNREPVLIWDKDFQCNTHYSVQKSENSISKDATKSNCPREHIHFHSQQRPKNTYQFDENIDHPQTGLASAAPVQLNMLNTYAPGLFTTGVCRSRRRSVTGGPASSGYDSMHIGTSELSLSHPDSASDCSALALTVPSQANKESSKLRPSNEVQWFRRHSSAAISHTSGSVGSLTSNISPMHPKPIASHNPTRPEVGKLTTPMTHLHVSSFLGLQSQVSKHLSHVFTSSSFTD